MVSYATYFFLLNGTIIQLQLKINKKQPKIGSMQPVACILLIAREEEFDMKLSDNIKFIRKENNLSQEQLAEQLGVSRQAVSKWESGQSYPEMDKVLLICKLYNYNIDELMNENVKEVSETNQSKNNINKYIEDFLEFITKTVDMFSSMKFWAKIKCIIEQMICIGILIAIFAIIGVIGNSILRGIIGGLPDNIYYIINNIFESIYLILAFGIGIIVLLHIFKVRYLDYYEIIKEKEIKDIDENIEKTELEKSDTKSEKKIVLEKKSEKIIIRDPEHSQSKFLAGVLKLVLLFIKMIAVFLGIGFGASFIALVTLLVVCFLFVRTGLIFIGGLLGIISALIINFIILQIIYNFIVSMKNHKTRIAILLISSLILAGLSIGMIIIGATTFNVVEENSEKIEDTYNIQMTDNLSIGNRNIEYIENDSDEIKIIVSHSKRYKTDIENENEIVYIYSYDDGTNYINTIRDIIKDINNKEIKDYNYNNIIKIYTSKANIEKLKQNKQLQDERTRDLEIERINTENNNLESRIIELESEIQTLESTIENQQNELESKEDTIKELQNVINEKE